MADLVPALRPAKSAARYDLLDRLTASSPNATAKTACVVGGMLTGADSIEESDQPRGGGMAQLFTGRVRATIGGPTIDPTQLAPSE